MVIREMSKDECLRVLAGSRLARLACARGNQPYVVPVYLAYHEASGCLYGFTTPGQKIEWMRANPLVCVEVDEVETPERWVSVIAEGRYEELPKMSAGDVAMCRAPERAGEKAEGTHWSSAVGVVPRPGDLKAECERQLVWESFKNVPEWWQPGSAVWASRAHRNPDEPMIPVFYRIRIDRVTGHAAMRDAGDESAHAESSPGGWLGRALARMFGGR